MSPDLLSLEEAIEQVIRVSRQLGAEPAELGESYGRFLAEPLRAPIDVPHASASLMDGYAVRSADTGPGRALHVAFEIPAGRVAPRAIAPGECARILTGAPIPEGADAVVKQEEIERTGDRITLREATLPGAHIRFAGSDARAGDMLLESGTEMDAGALSLTASVGVDMLSVARRPSIALLATGDELRSVGQSLQPGTIYESNTWGLAVQAREAGGLPLVLGRAPDSVSDIAAALSSARADIYVTSGGASVGDYDFAREVLDRLGGRKIFWQIAIRPGRPVLFGIIEKHPPTLFFALPGNPAASALTFDLLVRTATRAMMSARPIRRPRVKARLDSALVKPEDLTLLVRGTLLADGDSLHFRAARTQGSMSLTSLCGLGAVAVAPAGTSRIEAGALIEVEPWRPVVTT